MKTIKTIDATVGGEGDVTIPDEVRRLLGLERGGTIRFVVLDDEPVRLTGF
jgi:bifunctional DNA-binding transcriptional regulator/antitoxin component of YhaV-PrlF toxin-antitoxin module